MFFCTLISDRAVANNEKSSYDKKTSEIRTPSKAERKLILNIARDIVAKSIGIEPKYTGTKIKFLKPEIKVYKNFALMSAEPVNENGKKFDGDILNPLHGVKKVEVYVLLQKKSDGWLFLDWALNPTDVWWYDYDKQYGVPREFLIEFFMSSATLQEKKEELNKKEG